MNTPKTNTAKLLRRIDKDLESFSVPWRKQRYAAWLAGEMEVLMLKVLAAIGPQPQLIGATVATELQEAGGEGVAGGAGASECDLSSVSKQISQLESEGVRVTDVTIGSDGIDITYETPPVLKEEAQCSADLGDTRNPCAETAVLSSDERGSVVRVADVIVAPAVKELPRWPAEGEVTVVGHVPNPTLMAVQLVGDGRRVSLLKGFKREYQRGKAYRVRLSTRGSLGSPIYEEVA